MGVVDDGDAVSLSAGLAVLFAVVTEYLSWPRQTELQSELLAWAALPLVSVAAGRAQVPSSPSSPSSSSSSPFHKPGSTKKPSSPSSLWAVAALIAAVSFYKAEVGGLVLLPVLTPLLLAVQDILDDDSRPATGKSVLHALSHRTWDTNAVAALAVFALSKGDIWGAALSLAPVVGLATVYIAFASGPSMTRFRFLPAIQAQDVVGPLSTRVAALLAGASCVQFMIFGGPRGPVAHTLLLGATKSLTWHFVIQTHASWAMAAVIGTFSSLSARDLVMLQTELLAVSTVAAATLSLKQAVSIMPTSARFRSALWLFCIVPIAAYLLNLYQIHEADARLTRSHDLHAQHPVEQLIYTAEQEFKAMLARQSSTYEEAEAEYTRRHGIEPPPGFQAWHEFAVANGSPIIDDFDTIYTSVSPFLRASGQAVRSTMEMAQAQPGLDLWTCHLSPTVGCSHSYRTNDRHYSLLLDTLLGNLSGVLPDARLLLNHLDEPTVLLPPDGHAQPSVVVTNLAQKRAYETLTKHCKHHEDGEPPHSIPFVRNRTSAIDLCTHPEYASSDGHGLILSPTSLRLTEGLVPILSTGSLSTLGDILFPSPAYIEDRFTYDPSHDVSWSSKRRNLYWAGSNTGGYASDSSAPWHAFHRQRFVTMTQNLAPKLHRYINHDGVVVSSPFINGRLYDTAFTLISQCSPSACRAQKLFFPLSSWAPKDKALGSTLVFDTDGNGISGRFYKLLASNSAPLKHTLLREWHDDRLVPWVHYIPVSQGLDDLPELVAFLTSANGDGLAQRVAQNGREWFNKAFRNVDRAIYMYRLILELARAQDPDRPALI